jgi:hypothetical protein
VLAGLVTEVCSRLMSKRRCGDAAPIPRAVWEAILLRAAETMGRAEAISAAYLLVQQLPEALEEGVFPAAQVQATFEGVVQNIQRLLGKGG